MQLGKRRRRRASCRPGSTTEIGRQPSSPNARGLIVEGRNATLSSQLEHAQAVVEIDQSRLLGRGLPANQDGAPIRLPRHTTCLSYRTWSRFLPNHGGIGAQAADRHAFVARSSANIHIVCSVSAE